MPIPGGTTARCRWHYSVLKVRAAMPRESALTVATLLQLFPLEWNSCTWRKYASAHGDLYHFVGYAVYHFFRKQTTKTAGFAIVGSYVRGLMWLLSYSHWTLVNQSLPLKGANTLYNPYSWRVFDSCHDDSLSCQGAVGGLLHLCHCIVSWNKSGTGCTQLTRLLS